MITSSPLQKLMPVLARSLKPSVSATQIEYLNEPCIKVNENDEILGEISKVDCHKSDTVTLHRAFSVFIFNPEKKLLLQKRAASKITFPNLWTNSCCSHPLYNDQESDQSKEFIGVRRAARRKVEHELGIKELGLETMNVMGSGSLVLNPDEVSDTRFVDQKELDDMIHKENFLFSPWFTLFYKHKWLHQWWNNLGSLQTYKELEKIHHLT
uniref:isopentenyl-diphosphate Delta-isomerase n=1 Tax=Acrobeloides nanus TaxID=290746 RepID=A0A914CP12_9BILA